MQHNPQQPPRWCNRPGCAPDIESGPARQQWGREQFTQAPRIQTSNASPAPSTGIANASGACRNAMGTPPRAWPYARASAAQLAWQVGQRNAYTTRPQEPQILHLTTSRTFMAARSFANRRRNNGAKRHAPHDEATHEHGTGTGNPTLWVAHRPPNAIACRCRCRSRGT